MISNHSVSGLRMIELQSCNKALFYQGQKYLAPENHVNPIQTGGGGGLFEPPLWQNRANSYTKRAMTFKFSDFS